jgi:hypothetical protein
MVRSGGAIQMKEKVDLGSHFIGNSDKRKDYFISNETHCLLGM